MEWEPLCVGESQAVGGQDEKAANHSKQLRFVGATQEDIAAYGVS
jgi:hypothetical protein